MSGFYKATPSGWAKSREKLLRLGERWDDDEVINDLRWHEDRFRCGSVKPPMVGQLAKGYRWGHRRLRRFLYDVEGWAPDNVMESAQAMVEAIQGRATTGRANHASTTAQPRADHGSTTDDDAIIGVVDENDQGLTTGQPQPNHAPTSTRVSSIAESRDQKTDPACVEDEPSQQQLPGAAQPPPAEGQAPAEKPPPPQKQPDASTGTPDEAGSNSKSSAGTDHVAQLCELYREHSHRLTATGRRVTLKDSPNLRKDFDAFAEFAAGYGHGPEVVVALVKMAMTHESYDWAQRGGQMNDRIGGTKLVTYLFRFKGTDFKGVPTADKARDRLAAASDWLDETGNPAGEADDQDITTLTAADARLRAVRSALEKGANVKLLLSDPPATAALRAIDPHNEAEALRLIRTGIPIRAEWWRGWQAGCRQLREVAP